MTIYGQTELRQELKEMSMSEERVYDPIPVQGYKSQSQWSVDTVNKHKAMEEEILRLMDTYKTNIDIDQRWLAVARTEIEQSFMALNRAIFKPERVKL